MASNRRNNNDWGSWIPIIILFCIPSPVTWIIAFVWLVSKLRGVDWRTVGKGNVKRHPYDIQREQGARDVEWEPVDWSEGAAQGQTAPRPQGSGPARGPDGRFISSAAAASSGTRKAQKQAAPTQAKKGRAPSQGAGNGLIIGGAITTGIFALGTAGAVGELIDSIASGLSFADDITGVLVCLILLAGGLTMMFSGIGKKRSAERYVGYLAYIGANREVDLARMAADLDVPVNKLCKDLRKMLAKGILPTGYLDLAAGRLFLTETGFRPAEPVRAAEPKKEPTPERAAESEDAILREIRQVNDDIPDEVMSAKIDRIEEITRKILAYQKQHPNRAGQLRTFLNYYLPTTLKILRAYAQLDAQGIEGENISAAKARIEGMMDQVVAGFEKQLDKLFQDDALDVASDVKVLEDMLKKDGLSDGQGITMTF